MMGQNGAPVARRIRLKKDIIIPAGTVIHAHGPIRTEYAEAPYEHSIGFGKDVTGSFVMAAGDEEYAEEFLEVF